MQREHRGRLVEALARDGDVAGTRFHVEVLLRLAFLREPDREVAVELVRDDEIALRPLEPAVVPTVPAIPGLFATLDDLAVGGRRLGPADLLRLLPVAGSAARCEYLV